MVKNNLRKNHMQAIAFANTNLCILAETRFVLIPLFQDNQNWSVQS